MKEVLLEMVKDEVDAQVKAQEQQTKALDIKNVMDAFSVTIEKAMDSLKIPQNDRATYIGLVQKKL